MSKPNQLMGFLRDVYNIWVAERPMQLAAALAYYCIFAIAPIIYVTLAVAQFFLGEALSSDVLYSKVSAVLGPEAAEILRDAVMMLSQSTPQGSLLVSLIGFIVLLFAASGLFFQLQYTLNTIWRVPPPTEKQTARFLQQRLLAFVVVLGIGMVLVLAVTVNAVLTWFSKIIQSLININIPLSLISNLASFVIVVLALSLLYKFLPDVKVSWRHVLPGAVVATIMITIGILLLGWYFNNVQLSSALNATGSFVVLLMSFYYFAQIFLFGAIFGRVFAAKSGPQQEPTK
jgi:membrane protein